MRALRALCLISFVLLVAAPHPSKAASASEINDEVNATLRSFDGQNSSARELGRKAAGILVFPSVIKAGIGNLVSASFGFQLGVQSRSVIIMFMTEKALAGSETPMVGRLASMGRSQS
jgi:lipid-binding SYLF domain-containing protein